MRQRQHSSFLLAWPTRVFQSEQSHFVFPIRSEHLREKNDAPTVNMRKKSSHLEVNRIKISTARSFNIYFSSSALQPSKNKVIVARLVYPAVHAIAVLAITANDSYFSHFTAGKQTCDQIVKMTQR